jgi:hypothetical protein
MNEQELNAIVDARLAEELAARHEADRRRVKMQVVDQIRREAEKQHYDRINARHPIENKYSGLTREQHEARIAAMRAGAARDAAHMAEVNSRPIPGSLAHQRSLIPGSEGFRIKG